ncbi:hypothetical protein ACJ41O_014210 [Fusarium nematophilum]
MEIYSEIGAYLKVADLDGITKACKRLQIGFTRGMFYRVKFNCGHEKSVSKALQTFLHRKSDMGMKEMRDAIRHVSIGFIGANDLELPCRIAYSLEKMPQLRILDLDLHDVSAEQAATLWMMLNGTPQKWPNVHTLVYWGPAFVLKAVFRLCHLEKLQAVYLTEGRGSETYVETRKHCPRLKRLALSLDGDIDGSVLNRNGWGWGDMMSLEAESMAKIVVNRDFEYLEWLVFNETRPFSYYLRGTPPENRVKGLIAALQAMPRLRRFAFTLSKNRFGPSFNLVLSVDRPLTHTEAEAWYAALIQRIGGSVPGLEQLCIIDGGDWRPVVHRGTRDRNGDSMSVTHETFSWQTSNSTFPLGLLD